MSDWFFIFFFQKKWSGFSQFVDACMHLSLLCKIKIQAGKQKPDHYLKRVAKAFLRHLLSSRTFVFVVIFLFRFCLSRKNNFAPSLYYCSIEKWGVQEQEVQE